MAWLPDGALLVTEKSGTLYHIKNGVQTTVKNVPKVYTRGQGGLLDIVLHPIMLKMDGFILRMLLMKAKVLVEILN
jgi:glucose/arabinose dehydrogenase